MDVQGAGSGEAGRKGHGNPWLVLRVPARAGWTVAIVGAGHGFGSDQPGEAVNLHDDNQVEGRTNPATEMPMTTVVVAAAVPELLASPR
jgi:hypothetical protein